MQGAGRAAWPFPASDRQRRSAPAGTARTFKLLFLGSSALVGHSLGTVLIRMALGQLGNRAPCVCFFLAPPMVACKAARFFSRFRLYRLLTGEMGQLLSDGPFMLQLPLPPVPTRIYAGVGGPRASWLPFGTEANDGILSVSEATGRCKARTVEVPSLHTFIMNSRPVCDDMIRLLATLEQTTHPGGTHHQE
ncbi:MAG: alpha/beta hydrolase [Thiobacillus sp.]|nr:alpha/beta hydrolase [Thiobacillus sp.]